MNTQATVQHNADNEYRLVFGSHGTEGTWYPTADELARIVDDPDPARKTLAIYEAQP